MSNIHIQVTDLETTKIAVFGRGPLRAEHDVRQAIEDIADKIEEFASILAPEDTGELKSHPTDRIEFSGEVTEHFAFGEGFVVRGSGGRFVRPSALDPGREIAHTEIVVAEFPQHAIWVHEGTGIYGPHASPIVPRRAPYLRFRAYGKRWKLASVKGQKAQPFLTEAFQFVDHAYVPLRIEQLHLEVSQDFR